MLYSLPGELTSVFWSRYVSFLWPASSAFPMSGQGGPLSCGIVLDRPQARLYFLKAIVAAPAPIDFAPSNIHVKFNQMGVIEESAIE